MTGGDARAAGLLKAASEHRLAGRFVEAVGVLNSILPALPRSAVVHHELGLSLAALGDARAVEHLGIAVELEPDNADRLTDLGHARIGFGDVRGGIANLRAAVATTPSNEMILVRLGTHLVDIDFAAGDAWLCRALAPRRAFGAGYVARGVALYRNGRTAEAAEVFRRGTVEDPGYDDGFAMLAGALEALGAPKAEVMKAARIAAERMPNRRDLVTPVMQYLRDIGDEASSVAMSTRLVTQEMEDAANDAIGSHGFRILAPDELITRIGELAHQLDLHVKAKQLGWFPPFVTILLAPPQHIVNKAFLDYWRRYVTVVDDPALIEKLQPLKHRVAFNPVYIRLPDGRAMSKNRVMHAVQAEWQRQGRGPLLALTRHDAERGREGLRRLGIPDDAWFVCLHVREAGYMREDAKSAEAARNADIRAFFPAIEAITRRNGWIVRLGDPSMTPLPPMRNVVDYALSDQRSDWMDVFLAASCRFIIGTTSGMALVCVAFGVPIAAAGYFPPGEKMVTGQDLFIPKLVRETASGRFLNFEESLKMPLALTYTAQRFGELGLEAVDNEPEDILSLTEEMLDRVDRRAAYTEDDEALQARWNRLLRPFSTGDAGARVGRGFLRRHRHLFQAT